MFRFLSISIILLIPFSNVNGEVIKKIDINGNNRISDETIKVYGNIELNKDYKETNLNQVLKDLYETKFFEDIKIEIKNNVLILNVKEYPFISQLIVVGEKSQKYTSQLKKIISLKEKRSFIKSNLPKDIERIKSLYSSIGYNSTEVEIKTKNISKNNVDVLINIKRGEKTKIRSIFFIGNKNISSRRLKDVIASEEHKFWKILSSNTNFTKNLLELDTRLLRNYYKSIGFYDVKINSKSAKIRENDEIELSYTIEEGQRYTINKISTNVDSVFDKELFFL